MNVTMSLNFIMDALNNSQGSSSPENVYPIVDFCTVFFPLIVGFIVWLYLSRPLVFIVGNPVLERKKDEFGNYINEYILNMKLVNKGKRTAKIKDIDVQGYQDANPGQPLSYTEPIDGGKIFFNRVVKFANPLPNEESLNFNINLSFIQTIANYLLIRVKYYDYDTKILHYSKTYYYTMEDDKIQDALDEGVNRIKQLVKREKKLKTNDNRNEPNN